jgi:O-methyltransferase
VDIRTALANRAARLPAPARRALHTAHRHLPIPGKWTYNADGLATAHYSPFLEDPEFASLYDRMAAHWFPGLLMDARWRMWLLTRYALHARHLPGNYAEFGTYRGGCAWMVLSTTDLTGRELHLFDTFEGIPESNLTAVELRAGMGGQLNDTSVGYVEELLKPWDPIPRLWPGDVFETVPDTETGDLAFVHLDLNAAAPTGHVLAHVYDRLVPGAVVVFDDYGWRGYSDQRRVIDAFMSDKSEPLIALPTGQAVFHRAQ